MNQTMAGCDGGFCTAITCVVAAVRLAERVVLRSRSGKQEHIRAMCLSIHNMVKIGNTIPNFHPLNESADQLPR